MKNLILNFFAVFAFVMSANAQCGYDNIQFGTSPAPTVVGSPVILTSCLYAGEFRRVTGLIGGATYRFDTCIDAVFDSQLTIYPAGGGGSLAYNDDFCGTQSQLDFVAPVSGDYDVLLDEFFCTSNSTCMTLQATLLSMPATNIDNCAEATMITTCNSTFTGTTASATIDGPGTSCTGGTVAPDHWYTIVGTGATITASLCGGTDYDSKLDIYTGSCGSLVDLVCNDDFCGLQSQVSWTGVLGTTYYIRVHGFNGQTGNYTLNVTNDIPNDNCAGAQAITAGSYAGSTICATPEVVPFCGTGDGTGGGVWYTYTSPTCVNVNANTCGAANFDTKIRVFTGTCGALDCVTGNDDACAAQSDVNWTASPNVTYYILVHGWNTSVGTFTMTLSESPYVDNVAPIADVATLADVTAECEVTSLTAPTATDNCAGSITGTHDATLPITAQGTTVVTWTYDDGNGNTSTQTQNVVIDDVTAPVMVCSADITVSNDPGACGAVVTFPTPDATDNCAVISDNLIVNGSAEDGLNNWNITAAGGDGWAVSGATYEGTSSFIGSYDWCVKNQVVDLVTAGYTPAELDAEPEILVSEWYKASGCCSATDQYFFSADLLDETMNVVANFSLGSQGAPVSSGAAWTEVANTFTSYGTGVRYVRITHGSRDNEFWGGHYGTEIDATSVRVNQSVTVSQTAGLTSGSVFPVGTTTVTFTATDANGNSSTCSFDVVVEDVEAPVADVATLADINEACEVTALTAPTATDNCGSITGTHDATLPITASTTVTWTYDDGNGNTTTQTQEVIIDDVTAPVADEVSLADVTAECEVTALTAPTATDNCAGSITGTHDATLPITASTTVTWTYDDGNGNTSTQTQEVIIDDVTAPVADEVSLADVTAECEVTALTAPTATDNCAGSITGTHDATLPITASTTVTWTYDDGNGNTSTQTQEVIIDDATAPVADAVSLADITSECDVTALTAPTATDNCAGSITGTHDATLPITTSTTVTWTYDDGNGNTSTQTQEVIINSIDATVTVVDNTITANNTDAGITYQWVDCDNGFQDIDGETGQSFTATETGTYAVIVSNGSCDVMSDCEYIEVIGLNSLQANNMKIYPNPASESITIEAVTNGTIEIIDFNGKLVKTMMVEEGENHLDVQQLATGTYTVRMVGTIGVYTKQIVINRH